MAFFNLWCPDNRTNRGDYSVTRDEICASLNNVISGTNRLVRELNNSHGYQLEKITEIRDPDDMVKGIHNLQKKASVVIKELDKLSVKLKFDLDPQAFEKYEQCNQLLQENLEAVYKSMQPLLTFGCVSFQEMERLITRYRISTCWAFFEIAFALSCGFVVFKFIWMLLTRGSDVSVVSSVGIISVSCSFVFALVLFVLVDRAICRMAGRLENEKLLYFNNTMHKLRSDLKRPFINLHYGMMAQAIRVRRKRSDFRDSDSESTNEVRLRNNFHTPADVS